MDAPVILCWAMPLANVGGSPGDVEVVAMTETGEMLYVSVVARRFSTAFALAEKALSRFARRFPEGYRVEHVSAPAADLRVKAALERHRKLGVEGDRRL